ncbi:hypothetical protein ACHQM5_019161 [Ranunculus cassubicifolius]
MSSGEVRKVSRQDIQLVQNLIERCLQLYMNQKEVVDTLLLQAKIEPGFTELVWQKLEEENREFFKAYHVRLMVKHQIMIFNKLLERQVELMRSLPPVGVSSLTISNGSNSSMHQAPFFIGEHTVPLSRPENMNNSVGPLSMYLNGRQSVQGNTQSIDDNSLHAGRMDSSHMGIVHGLNGVVIKSENDYTDNSVFAFGNDGVLGIPPTIDTVAPSFGSIGTNPLETEASSFGFLGQIPRNFSLSDLTAEFSQSSEVLENYSRSPFLGTDVGEFLNSPVRECEGDNRRLDTISEGLRYDEFR